MDSTEKTAIREKWHSTGQLRGAEPTRKKITFAAIQQLQQECDYE